MLFQWQKVTNLNPNPIPNPNPKPELLTCIFGMANIGLANFGRANSSIQTTKHDPCNASALGRSKLQFYFRRLWTKVHQLKYACTGGIAVCNTVFRSTISCFIPEIFVIKFTSCLKFGPNFDVFGVTAKLFFSKSSQIWSNFINYGYHRTRVKIWWQWTKRLRRLGTEKRNKQQQQNRTACIIAEAWLLIKTGKSDKHFNKEPGTVWKHDPSTTKNQIQVWCEKPHNHATACVFHNAAYKVE